MSRTKKTGTCLPALRHRVLVLDIPRRDGVSVSVVDEQIVPFTSRRAPLPVEVFTKGYGVFARAVHRASAIS